MGPLLSTPTERMHSPAASADAAPKARRGRFPWYGRGPWQPPSMATSSGTTGNLLPTRRKHGVTFVEAATVFDDVDFLVRVDLRDSARFIAVGFSSAARVLVVVHATRAERIRLISARRATLPKERLYAERRER